MTMLKKTRHIGIAGLLLIISISLIKVMERAKSNSPEYWIDSIRQTDANDVETRKYYVDKLVSLGPRAVPAVVDTIRMQSPWTRRTWQLIEVCDRIGKPAHQYLIRSIDQESSSIKRIYLIYTIQQAYGDFSKADLWVKCSKSNPDLVVYFIRQLAEHSEDEVPSFWVDSKKKTINPEFLRWFNGKRHNYKSFSMRKSQ